MKTRVLLADSDTLFRQGLVKLLTTQPDIRVVGEVANSREVVTETKRLKPDLILIELHMFPEDGLEALRKIREEVPGAKCLILTALEKEEDLRQALIIGVQGYLPKNVSPEHLFWAIKSVMKGETAISPSLAAKVLRKELFWRGREKKDSPELTPRETEILQLLNTGASDKEISRQLCLSVSTVRHHVHNILRKLCLKNRVQAAVFARGLQGYVYNITGRTDSEKV